MRPLMKAADVSDVGRLANITLRCYCLQRGEWLGEYT